MKRFVGTFALTLTSAVGFTTAAQPESAALGESFRLRVGESARIESEALEIGLDEVSSDSRCPKGEQCVWEGDATVKVWVQKDSEARETLELHTSARELNELSAASARSQPTSYRGYEVKLESLDPYPVSGRTIEQDEYEATLEVSRVPRR